MSQQLMYTQDQLNIELLKQGQGQVSQTLNRIETELLQMDRKIEANFRWVLTVMGTVGIGILGIMAHGFKWL
jgi:hypothetical protein